MVGGDREVYQRCLPIFEAMGKSIRYMGEAGSGQHTKMANQIAIAGTLAGVCEAIAYARTVGLDVDEVISTLDGGAASSWQLRMNGPKSALFHQALHQGYDAGRRRSPHPGFAHAGAGKGAGHVPRPGSAGLRRGRHPSPNPRLLGRLCRLPVLPPGSGRTPAPRVAFLIVTKCKKRRTAHEQGPSGFRCNMGMPRGSQWDS